MLMGFLCYEILDRVVVCKSTVITGRFGAIDRGVFWS